MESFVTSTCESCGKPHSYPAPSPGNDYYDLCRPCALKHGFERVEYDFRLQQHLEGDRPDET